MVRNDLHRVDVGPRPDDMKVIPAVRAAVKYKGAGLPLKPQFLPKMSAARFHCSRVMVAASWASGLISA